MPAPIPASTGWSSRSSPTTATACSTPAITRLPPPRRRAAGSTASQALPPAPTWCRADQSNFDTGGALQGRPRSAINTVDPNNNVENDDNADPVAGNGVVTLPITLAYNTEPTAGVGNDSNTTLDIGVHANDAPVADNDSYNVNEDNVLTVVVPGVLDGDTDADGDPLSAVLVSGPLNGSLSLNANGSFTYTPNANFNGSDSFT